MHYYKRNIGDYAKKAARLSMLEHGAYNLLIDACYDRERFPTKEEAIDWCWCRTPEEVAAVEFVLTKFFELKDGVYVQPRIAQEIGAFQEFCAEQERKGKKGGRPKKGAKEKPDGNPTETQRVLESGEEKPDGFENKPGENPNPLTTNQEPLTTESPCREASGNTSPRAHVDQPPGRFFQKPPGLPSWVEDDAWQMYAELRINRNSPVTDTILPNVIRELAKLRKDGHDVNDILRQCATHGSTMLKPFSKPNPRDKPRKALHEFDDVDYTQGVKADGSF